MPQPSQQELFQRQQKQARVHEPIIGPIRRAAEALIPRGGLNLAPPNRAQSAYQSGLNYYAHGGPAPAAQTGAGQMVATPSPQGYTFNTPNFKSPAPMGAMPGSVSPSSNQQPQHPSPFLERQGPGLMDMPIPPHTPPAMPLQRSPTAQPGMAPTGPINNMQQQVDANQAAAARQAQMQQVAGNYRQQQLGGIHDAVTELGNANRFNASRQLSPFNALAAPVSGPGMYGQVVNAGGLMNNAEAQQFQQNVGYMPSRTVGGAFGGPGGQPLPFEKTPATGAQIDAYLGQNPNGRFFQGAQAGMVSTARGLRPGFTDGQPLPDLSQKPQFNAGAYETTPGGALTPSSATQLEAGRKAQELFDSRGGGVAKRQADYQERTGYNQWARKTNVANKAQNRAEARRERRGLFTPEEQLARANPGAYQARLAAESQVQAANSNRAADRELGLARIRSAENIAEGRNLTAKDIAQKKLDAEYGTKEQPVAKEEVKATPEPPTPFQTAGEWLAKQIGLGAITPGMNPSRATKAGQLKHGQPGELNPLKRRVTFEDLIPKESDSPAQRKARQDLAKRYSGMRSQLQEAGRLP